MLANFNMAFYRANIRAPQLINNVYYKFTVNAFKLHLSKRQLVTKSKHSSHKRGRNANQPKEKLEIHNLSDYIELRKLEAKKSIVVQVASWTSCKDLLNYCSQFGEIANVFYYVLPKDHQFVLLEYKKLTSTMNALNSATYVDKENTVPSRTNVMWFRKVPQETKTRECKLEAMPYINSYNYTSLKEPIIRNVLSNAPTVSSQMAMLYKETKIPELEIRLKFQIITSLEQYFSGIFPNVIVHPFGSFINGFGKKLSDLDVVLFADGLKKENALSKLVFHTKLANINEKQQTYEFMGVLADTMKYMIPGISHVRKIFNARVPIIKFNNIFTHTECDLSMSNVIATYMTELLYLYGELDARVRPLVFTIRKWAQDNKLTCVHPGRTITNFSLTLLIIFYLQQQKVLPSINKMQDFEAINASGNDFLDRIYLHRIRKSWITNRNDDHLSSLLLNFFKYYSNFDFNENEICLREGITLKKGDNHQPLYIHNPFQQGLNVSKNVSQNEIDRMRSLMVIAISNLENTRSLKSKNWGILSIFNYSELPHTSIDVSQIFEKEDKEVSEQEPISENSEAVESIQESNADNKLLNTESQSKLV